MFSCFEGRKKIREQRTRIVKNMERIITKRLFLFTILTLLTISVVFGTTGVVIPSKLGIEKVDLGKTFKVDNKNYPFAFLDGMLIEDGKRLISLDDKTYSVQVKTFPDETRLNGVTEAYTYVFDSTATFYDPSIRAFKALAKSNEIRISEKMYIAVARDEFGNVSDVGFVPPTLEKLDILDSQGPITNISGRKFLLSSKSPYRIISKTVLPENSVLILENGVTIINALNADMNIKGAIVTIGPVTFLGTGTLSLSDSGMIYLNAVAVDTNINADRGALLFLDNSYLKDANLSLTNFVIIRKTTLQNVKINGAFAVYIIDSTIDKLEIQNCGYVIVNNSSINSATTTLMSKTTIYNSKINSLTISDLSTLSIVSSRVNEAFVDRGSILKTKYTTINNTKLENYSISYFFKSTIQALRTINSKYHTLESSIKNIQK